MKIIQKIFKYNNNNRKYLKQLQMIKKNLTMKKFKNNKQIINNYKKILQIIKLN